MGIESFISAHEKSVTSVTSINNFIISTSLDGNLCIISSIYRHITSKIAYKDPILTCAISESHIITGFEKKLSVRINPLFTTKMKILGNQDLQQNYFSYLKDIYLNRNPKHNQTMDQFVILPYYYNTLHIYTYLNLIEYLKPSLEFSSPMIAVPHSPFCLSIYLGIVTLQRLMCKYLILDGKENPYLFRIIEDHLIELNIQGIPELPELYEAAYKSVSRKSLPKTCDLGVQLPIRKMSITQRIILEDFLDFDSFTEGGALLYKENYIGVQMNLGSTKSIEFLQSLLSCPNTDVFRVGFIQDMVKYK